MVTTLDKKNSVYAAIILFFSMLIPGISYSQKMFTDWVPENYYCEYRSGFGFVIPHHIELQDLQTHFAISEFSIGYLSYGKSRWESIYEFPRLGLSFWYSGFNNSSYIGTAYALQPYISFSLIGKPSSRLCFRLAFGVGYLTKTYDPVTNYKNIAIGSHYNAAINFKFEYQHQISDRLVGNAAVDFQHFSNGSMKTPNYGLNCPSMSIGMMYHIHRTNSFLKKKLLPELYSYEFDGKKYATISLTYYMGFKDQSFSNGDVLMANAIAVDFLKAINFKHKLGVGFDFSRYMPLNLESEELVLLKYGINGAWHMSLWTISFDFNLGVDLYKRNDVYLGTMYEKLAFKYHFDSGLYTYFGLKANYGRADFISFGVGYDLKVMYY